MVLFTVLVEFCCLRHSKASIQSILNAVLLLQALVSVKSVALKVN